MSAVLQAKGIGKKFGAVVAAADIHIDIHPGERVSLIGSNGAGKTTFVNMVTGYLKPDAGQMLLGGQDITALDPRAITRLGVARAFQIPQLFGELTVLDNMLIAQAAHAGRPSLWRRAHDPEAVMRADELLERFQLQSHRLRRTAELPGGVRKLLDMAMSLTARPKLLLLDEPTSAVAADEKFPMMERAMSAIEHDRHTPVLFVEHDLDIVRWYATRVIAFYNGRILADGDPGRVLASADVRRFVTGELPKESSHA
ncbi:ABC transporter ATP-binding protein [Aquabacterium sp.]|uniref:ABC transporter ATP-binding protein n=1 Tax=Aquabacterium sp. TaxID=1872578 RepID=UPI0024897312|nr:ATP-binding cassette domain-containing protein [Aquabacterium sp.]MDI1349087.1 ATP-binding cassette domain-containing protein [Aquabacterium sp.]